MNITDMTVDSLAHLADCAIPDCDDSPGAKLLKNIREAALLFDEDDDVFEVADAVLTVYLHDQWSIFVDLCIYHEEPPDGFNTPLRYLAGVMLTNFIVRTLVKFINHEE